MTDIDKSQNSKRGGPKPKYEIKDNETGKVYYSGGLDSTYDIIRGIDAKVSKYSVRMALSRGDPVANGRFDIKRLDGSTSKSKVAKQPIPNKRLRNLKFKRKNKGPPGMAKTPMAAPVGSAGVEGNSVGIATGLAPAKVVVVPHDKEKLVDKAETSKNVVRASEQDELMETFMAQTPDRRGPMTMDELQGLSGLSEGDLDEVRELAARINRLPAADSSSQLLQGQQGNTGTFSSTASSTDSAEAVQEAGASDQPVVTEPVVTEPEATTDETTTTTPPATDAAEGDSGIGDVTDQSSEPATTDTSDRESRSKSTTDEAKKMDDKVQASSIEDVLEVLCKQSNKDAAFEDMAALDKANDIRDVTARKAAKRPLFEKVSTRAWYRLCNKKEEDGTPIDVNTLKQAKKDKYITSDEYKLGLAIVKDVFMDFPDVDAALASDMKGQGSGNIDLHANLDEAEHADLIASIAYRAKELALDPGVKATQGVRMSKLLEAVEAKDTAKATMLMETIERHATDYDLRNAEKDATQQAQLETTGSTSSAMGTESTLVSDSGLSEADISATVNYIVVACNSVLTKLGEAKMTDTSDLETTIRANPIKFNSLLIDGGSGSKDITTANLISTLNSYAGSNNPVVVAVAEKGSDTLNPTIKIASDMGILQGAGAVDDAIARRVALNTRKLRDVTDAIKEKETRMGYVLDQPSELTDGAEAEADEDATMEGSGLLDTAYMTYPENSPSVMTSEDLDEERMALSFSRKRHLRFGMKEKKGKKARGSDYSNFRRPEPKDEPNRIHDSNTYVLPYGHPGTAISRNRPGEPILQRPYYRTDLVANAPRRGLSQQVVGDLAVTASLPGNNQPRRGQEAERRLNRYAPAANAPGMVVDMETGLQHDAQAVSMQPGGLAGMGRRQYQPEIKPVVDAPRGGYGFNPLRGSRRFMHAMDDEATLLAGRGRRGHSASAAVRSQKRGMPRYNTMIPGSSRSSHAPRNFSTYVGMDAEEVAGMMHEEGFGVRLEYEGRNYAMNYVPNRIRIKVDDYGEVISMVQG